MRAYADEEPKYRKPERDVPGCLNENATHPFVAFRDREQTCALGQPAGPQWPGNLLATRMKLVRWIPPLVDFCLNVDGVSKGNPGFCGSGGCIRDKRGTILLAFANFYGVGNNIIAETRALCDGLRLAHFLGVRLSAIYSDSTHFRVHKEKMKLGEISNFWHLQGCKINLKRGVDRILCAELSYGYSELTKLNLWDPKSLYAGKQTTQTCTEGGMRISPVKVDEANEKMKWEEVEQMVQQMRDLLRKDQQKRMRLEVPQMWMLVERKGLESEDWEIQKALEAQQLPLQILEARLALPLTPFAQMSLTLPRMALVAQIL
ncbi:hypothetical protein Taro_027034 [Colocasia esculenta]|uniref:RNase H type-1 domain-containing protein n=1 Tax=Colocasia esculenta TaxID=4460 RepID=A0A843VLB4_COLES|nr:hypothetical protein [Colocasia esculenta]